MTDLRLMVVDVLLHHGRKSWCQSREKADVFILQERFSIHVDTGIACK